MAERIIPHSDLNNCHASIECMLHPEFIDYEQHQRRLTLETTIDDTRRRVGTASINFASLTYGLKMPAHREIEYKMPSPMYQ